VRELSVRGGAMLRAERASWDVVEFNRVGEGGKWEGWDGGEGGGGKARCGGRREGGGVGVKKKERGGRGRVMR